MQKCLQYCYLLWHRWQLTDAWLNDSSLLVICPFILVHLLHTFMKIIIFFTADPSLYLSFQQALLTCQFLFNFISFSFSQLSCKIIVLFTFVMSSSYNVSLHSQFLGKLNKGFVSLSWKHHLSFFNLMFFQYWNFQIAVT